MQPLDIKSNVVIFHHDEYGSRLIFTNGKTNPRDQLGKNGVTIHGWFASLFYKTVRVNAMVMRPDGKFVIRQLNINRNSLMKYLGKDTNPDMSDSDLIDSLNALSPDDKTTNQGRDLRHAGQHNHQLLNDNWITNVIDYIKGSFLGWLYQKTISGVNLIKVRFLFVRTEKELLETGELLAKNRHHEAYTAVPAYKTHIHTNGVLTDKATFSNIPPTSKSNYIKVQSFDSETHYHGKYPTAHKTDTSTGTTGKPTEWVRGEPELRTVKQSLTLAARIQFGTRRLNYINAFAFGPWATGLTTYELMRETGSVFATGPDKEKILDKLISIAKDEAHQLEKAVDLFKSTHPDITVDDKKLIIDLIEKTLKSLLKNRKLSLKEALFNEFMKNERSRSLMDKYHHQIIAMAITLNQEKQQILIAGYPPFLKDLTAEAKARGLDFSSFSVAGVVGGQGISEAMRDRLIAEGFNEVYSSYGASDLDINLGVETEYEISVRKAIENNPRLAQELFGKNKGLPMVFHYDPMNYHVECDETDELIFTCTRNEEQMRTHAGLLFRDLTELNQDFQYQINALGPDVELPNVRFFKRNTSPISEAGGHRKQVLIFQKENLPEHYVFPEGDKCRAVVIHKSEMATKESLVTLAVR